MFLSTSFKEWPCHNDLFLEQAEGYVKYPEKSTSPLSTMKEVFEHGAQNDKTGGKKLKVAVKVLSFGRRSGETDKTRTVKQKDRAFSKTSCFHSSWVGRSWYVCLRGVGSQDLRFLGCDPVCQIIF
jgi:hypothetical protein